MMQGSLAVRLRVLRAERGWTMRDAAERMGVRPATLSDIENGRSHPHDVTLAKLAKGYGVPLEDLLEEQQAVPLSEARLRTYAVRAARARVVAERIPLASAIHNALVRAHDGEDPDELFDELIVGSVEVPASPEPEQAQQAEQQRESVESG